MQEAKGKRIVAVGWYGAGNLGDEILLRQVVEWSAQSGAGVTAISIDPVYTNRVHGIEAVDYFDYAAIASAIRDSDLLVYGGGGIFQTHNPFSVPGLFAQAWNDISSYARIGLMARQLGVPCVMLGQGVGPLDNPDALEVVRVMFEDALAVSVRDDRSMAWLVQCGVRRDVVVAPDPVWAWRSQSAVRGADQGARVLGIAVRPWAAVDGWQDHLVSALRIIISAGGIRLVWLPCQTNDVPGRAVSDVAFIQALADRLEGQCEQQIVVASDPDEWMRALAGCDAVLAMRLHAQLLALSAGKPVLSIEYDEKMASTSMLAGVPAGSRLDVSEPVAHWHSRMANWWRDTASGCEVPSAAVARLSAQALQHKGVLQDAIAVARPRSDRLELSAYDWIGAWEKRHFDAVLSDRDVRSAELVARLSDTASQLADSQVRLGQLDEERAGLRKQVEHLAAVEQQLQHVAAQLDESKQQHALSESRRLELEDIVSGLQGRIDSITAQLARAEQVRVGLDQELDAVRSESAQWREQARSLEDNLGDALGRLEVLQRTYDGLLQVNTNLRSEHDRLIADHSRLHDESESRRRELEGVYASYSWRMTRPFRFLARVIRGLVSGRSPSR